MSGAGAIPTLWGRMEAGFTTGCGPMTRSLWEATAMTAIVSHDHPEGVKGAQCVAALIYWLRTVRIYKDDVERAVRRRFGYVIPSLADIYKIGGEGHFDGTCQETVPMAIRCFLEAHSFEEVIRIAVMAGGDTDTKAAIALIGKEKPRHRHVKT